LAVGEFPEATTENSIETFKQAETVASEYIPIIQEVNTDRGTQFYSNPPESMSRYEQYPIERGINHIPSGMSNPQTNDKVERFWLEYDRHRWRFSTFEEFITLYNKRLYGALWLDICENPGEAAIRKLHPESLRFFFMRWVK